MADSFVWVSTTTSLPGGVLVVIPARVARTTGSLPAVSLVANPTVIVAFPAHGWGAPDAAFFTWHFPSAVAASTGVWVSTAFFWMVSFATAVGLNAPGACGGGPQVMLAASVRTWGTGYSSAHVHLPGHRDV